MNAFSDPDMEAPPSPATGSSGPADLAPPDSSYDASAFRFCVVVGSRLDPLAAVDAIGHSVLALGAALGPGVLGDMHVDASSRGHARLARFPLIVLTARSARIGKLLFEARHQPAVTIVDYPDEGQSTTHDRDYAAALARKPTQDLTYRAAAMFGPRDVMDGLCGHFSLYQVAPSAEPTLSQQRRVETSTK